MSNPDWRAQLREAGIERRPPPPSSTSLQARVAAVPVETLRPARQQRPGNVITFEQLERHSESPPAPPSLAVSSAPPTGDAAIAREKAALEELVANAVESALDQPIASEPLPQSAEPAALEVTEMPKKKSGPTSAYSDEFKQKVIEECLTGPPGTQARLAKKHGISDGLVSQWVARHRKKFGLAGDGRRRPAQATLVSSGAASRVRPAESADGDLPPLPTIALSGLEEYIKALVHREVGLAMKEWRRKMLELG